MEPSASDHSERIWVIQHYLNGTLPEDLRQQVEQRRESDPDFDRQVLTVGLLDLYAENERNTRSFYEETDKLLSEVISKRPDYTTTKPLTFLPELIKLAPQLLVGLAALLALVFVWIEFSPLPTVPVVEQLAVVAVNDEQAGISGASVAVVRYDRLPGWRGLFQSKDWYKWPGDTLFLYGKAIKKTPLDSLQLIVADPADPYSLQVGQREFRIRKGQQETSPLAPDETP